MVSRRSVLCALPAAALAVPMSSCARQVEHATTSGTDPASTPASAVTTTVPPSGVPLIYQPGVNAQVRHDAPAVVETALRRVRSVWAAPIAAAGRPLSSPRGVQVTATRDQFTALGGGQAGGVAATTKADGTVILAPDLWTGTTQQGQIVVMAHEFTHVVLHSQTSNSARWLVEGPPEWTAYHDTGLALSVIAPRMAAATRAGRPATGPPTDAEFTEGPLQSAYQSAFTWCSFLVQHSTADVFTGFVIAATDRPAAHLAQIFESHYGTAIASLSNAYQRFQQTTFGTAPTSA